MWHAIAIGTAALALACGGAVALVVVGQADLNIAAPVAPVPVARSLMPEAGAQPAPVRAPLATPLAATAQDSLPVIGAAIRPTPALPEAEALGAKVALPHIIVGLATVAPIRVVRPVSRPVPQTVQAAQTGEPGFHTSIIGPAPLAHPNYLGAQSTVPPSNSAWPAPAPSRVSPAVDFRALDLVGVYQ